MADDTGGLLTPARFAEAVKHLKAVGHIQGEPVEVLLPLFSVPESMASLPPDAGNYTERFISYSEMFADELARRAALSPPNEPECDTPTEVVG